MPKFKDSFKGKGTVSICKIRKSDNSVVEQFTNHNLIVKKGRIELIKFLAGQSSKRISRMAIGKGGADLANSPFTPVAPIDSDSGLYSYIDETPASPIMNLEATNPKITFTSLFDCEDVNSLVNECGLVFDDVGKTMFARHTFKTVSLESGTDFALQITWTIEF